MIRALLVDDEAPARRKLRQLLSRAPDFEVVGEAADGVEAVAAIREAAPDVVFLDIQMPNLDGFGVIAQIGVLEMPLVVFVTAYDEHALRAFEVHALDYLLKPFAPSRFERLLDRLRQQLAPADRLAAVGGGSPGGDLAARIERLLAEVTPKPGYLRQILVEPGPGRQLLLAVETIDRIEAEGNYLLFVTAGGAGGEYRRRGTLSDLLGRLDPARFLRVNRSEIVRLDAIREVQPWFHGDARVVLADGSVRTWSRRYRAKVEGLF
jgi:two-component system LytT family response regulator